MTQIRVFRLDPIRQNDPSWSCSSVCETLWVGAESDKEARDIAARSTLQAIAFKPGNVLPGSPWQDDKVTSCVWETGRTDLKKGEAMLLDGARLPKT